VLASLAQAGGSGLRPTNDRDRQKTVYTHLGAVRERKCTHAPSAEARGTIGVQKRDLAYRENGHGSRTWHELHLTTTGKGMSSRFYRAPRNIRGARAVHGCIAILVRVSA